MKDLINAQYKISSNILELMKKGEVSIKQVNGQRILNGPPPGWVGPPPGHGTEIFVGKLPREIYEDTVYPFFALAGQIYELRLMMDFSGNNRGYCFVTYTTAQEAENAINSLNDKEILPGRRIGVIASINNCKLWLGRLPKQIKSAEIILKICAKTAEVDTVLVYRNGKYEAEFAIVEYKSHRAAAMARRILVPEKNHIFCSSVSVDWANPDISPFNVIEESGLAVNDKHIKDLYILKDIRRKVIGCLGNRSLSSNLKSRDEILSQNIECYIRGNIITSTSDSDPNIKNNNMTSTPKQKKVIKQPRKISASEPSNSPTQNSPFLLPRPIKLTEQPTSASFSLFDDFSFSLSSPTTQEDQRWAASFEQLRMGTANQNINLSDGWVDDFDPRFSNLNLQTEEARPLFSERPKIDAPKDGDIFSSMVRDKGFSGQRGKMVRSIKPMIWPEKAFPFHQPGPSSIVPNALQCDYVPTPSICVFPQQMPYVEPWLLDNRTFLGYNQHHCIPTSCPVCIEEFAHSNMPRIPKPCNLSYCNQPLRINEIQTQECTGIQNDSEDQQQTQATCQLQATFTNRRQKSRAAFEKPKSARKIQTVLKMNQRRRNNLENQGKIPEQNDFVSKPVEQIPKGARPILSARK